MSNRIRPRSLLLCLALTLLWLEPLHATESKAPPDAPASPDEPVIEGEVHTVPEADGAEAAEDDLAADDAKEPTPGIMVQAFDEGQEAVSRSVLNLSRRMDQMLGAREIYPDEAYDSQLRLRFIQRIDDAGGSQLEPDADIRLSLPGTEEHLSVIFLSDDFDDPVDRERRTDRELDETTRRSIALRYLAPVEGWQTSISAGLRSGDPIDLLTRARAWREFRVGEWGFTPGQSVFWYDERGAGATTDVRIEHPISIQLLARSNSSATWFKRDEQFYYDQILSLLQSLTPRRGLLWQLGLQAESEPNHLVTRYYAQVRWRSLAHRDWLILEVRPQFIRERENDFRLERRIYVGFELIFGHD